MSDVTLELPDGVDFITDGDAVVGLALGGRTEFSVEEREQINAALAAHGMAPLPTGEGSET